MGFTEFDILEKYRKSFHESGLGRLHSLFLFECMAKAAGLSEQRLGRRNIFSPSAKIALMVLKAYTGILRQATGGTSEREHALPDFLWNLLEKLFSQRDGIHSEYGALLRYTQDYQKRLSIIRKELV